MTTRRRFEGFTLIEMVVVIGVVIALAGLTVSIATLVMRNAARQKTVAFFKELDSACAGYKADHGSFPRSAETDALDPRQHFNPTAPEYLVASRYLYMALSGGGAGKAYRTFTPKELSRTAGGASAPQQAPYVIDPFGFCVGYSTAGAVTEEEYRTQVRVNATAGRPNPPRGYNPTFDLWSTANATTASGAAKWIKNWGGD